MTKLPSQLYNQEVTVFTPEELKAWREKGMREAVQEERKRIYDKLSNILSVWLLQCNDIGQLNDFLKCLIFGEEPCKEIKVDEKKITFENGSTIELTGSGSTVEQVSHTHQVAGATPASPTIDERFDAVAELFDRIMFQSFGLDAVRIVHGKSLLEIIRGKK